jgi:hypothetical protein
LIIENKPFILTAKQSKSIDLFHEKINRLKTCVNYYIGTKAGTALNDERQASHIETRYK